MSDVAHEKAAVNRAIYANLSTPGDYLAKNPAENYLHDTLLLPSSVPSGPPSMMYTSAYANKNPIGDQKSLYSKKGLYQ
jgi:hypothetical protein